MTIKTRREIDQMIKFSLILDKTAQIIDKLGQVEIHISKCKLTLDLGDITISGKGDK